jgi:hypothetical protein
LRARTGGREPAGENRRLKEIVADLTFDNKRHEHLSKGNRRALPGSERR